MYRSSAEGETITSCKSKPLCSAANLARHRSEQLRLPILRLKRFNARKAIFTQAESTTQLVLLTVSAFKSVQI
jgi:hypothetical protein